MPFEGFLLSFEHFILDVFELFVSEEVRVEFQADSVIRKGVDKVFEVSGMVFRVEEELSFIELSTFVL